MNTYERHYVFHVTGIEATERVYVLDYTKVYKFFDRADRPTVAEMWVDLRQSIKGYPTIQYAWLDVYLIRHENNAGYIKTTGWAVDIPEKYKFDGHKQYNF